MEVCDETGSAAMRQVCRFEVPYQRQRTKTAWFLPHRKFSRYSGGNTGQTPAGRWVSAWKTGATFLEYICDVYGNRAAVYAPFTVRLIFLIQIKQTQASPSLVTV